MVDLPEAERDALRAVQALIGLNGHLAPDTGGPDERRLLELLESGGEAAGRVLAYLRELRGSGDGEALAYPERLGPWRDWCPPRGDLWGRKRGGDVVHRRSHSRPGRGDPGE